MSADDAIIDQVVEKCYSSKLRKTLLKTTDLTLEKLLETAQISETVSRQSQNYASKHAQQSHNVLSDDDEVNSLQQEDYVNRLNRRKGPKGKNKFPKSQFVRNSNSSS